MKAEFQRRYHSEIATPALDRPEQILVFDSTCGEEPAVGGDDVGREQVVASQTIAPAQIPETAAQGQPGDASSGDDSSGCRQTKNMCCMIEIAPRASPLRPGH